MPYVDVLAAGQRRLRGAQARQAAGLARPRGAARRAPRRPSSAARARALRRAARSSRTSSTSASSRRWRRRAPSCASARKLYPLPLDNMMWAAPYSAADATNDKQIDRGAGGAASGTTSSGCAGRWHSRIAALLRLHLQRRGRGDLGARAARAQAAAQGRRSSRSSRRRACRASLYAFDHRDGYVLAMAGGDDFDRSRVQPRHAGVPPAGLGLQADLLLAGARPRLRLRHAVERQAQGRGRSDHRRAVDPAEHRRQLQRCRCRSSARWCGRRIRRRSRSSTSSAPRTSRRGRTRLGITRRSSPRQVREGVLLVAGAGRLVRAHRRHDARLRRVRAQRPAASRRCYVRRVIDRKGRVLEDHTAWDDPWLDGDARLDRIAATMGARAGAGDRAAHRLPDVEAAARDRHHRPLGADPRHQGARRRARPAPRAAPATSGSSATPRAG